MAAWSTCTVRIALAGTRWSRLLSAGNPANASVVSPDTISIDVVPSVQDVITCGAVVGDYLLGGSALLIHGTPSADLLAPRAAARSLADRLLGRHPVSGPTETPIGRDRVLLEIPCDPLRPLADHFRTYVDRAFDDPWPSTICVRDYLAMDVVTTTCAANAAGPRRRAGTSS